MYTPVPYLNNLLESQMLSHPGLLVDWSGTYTAAMTFTGAVCCAAGLCLISVYFCRTGA